MVRHEIDLVKRPGRIILWPQRLPVRRVLTAARRRYHGAPLTERPSLNDPSSYIGFSPYKT